MLGFQAAAVEGRSQRPTSGLHFAVPTTWMALSDHNQMPGSCPSFKIWIWCSRLPGLFTESRLPLAPFTRLFKGIRMGTSRV